MSRKLTWTISLDDLEDLFKHTFGREREVAIIDVGFDETLGTLTIHLIDEEIDPEEDHLDSFYAGAMICDY